jgi:XTP/dITP diphosphohydrolase
LHALQHRPKTTGMPLQLPSGARLVAATHNPGKAVELAALLEDRFEVVSAAELGLPEPAETESTFVGNAVLKARAAAAASGMIALADDSGLSIRALDGAPGIFSARWAGPQKDFSAAMTRVEQRMAEVRGFEDPFAWFTAALAVAWPGGPVVAVEGRVEGRISFPARGANGFGYDPIFVPEGHRQTFGEMETALKESLSHRTRAFEALKAALF